MKKKKKRKEKEHIRKKVYVHARHLNVVVVESVAYLLTNPSGSLFFFVSLARSENHCRRCDRIREEPARCDNPDDVLSLRLCADGPPDLHGGAHAKVYKELSRGRLLGQSHR